MTAKSAELVKTDPAVSKMQEMIAANKPQMAALLGKHISVERLYQIALIALSRTPKLAQCTTSSVLGCIMESARMRLAPGAGAGATWLIPFENKARQVIECTLIVDYRAVIAMMKRDAGVETVVAEKVCKNDKFDYGISADGPYINWTPAKGDRGEAVGYVAASWNKAKALTGVIYKTIAEIDTQNKGKSASAAKGDGPWKTDPEWMYKKSVLRPLGKLNPGTENDDLSRAIALDERADLGLPQNLHLLADHSAAAIPDGEGVKSYSEPTDEKIVDDDAKKFAWFAEHTAKQGVSAEQFSAWAAQYPDDKARAEAGKAAWSLIKKEGGKTAAEAFAVQTKTDGEAQGETKKDEKAADLEATFSPVSVATSDLDGDDAYHVIKDDAEEPTKYFSKDPAVVAHAKSQKSSGGIMAVAYVDHKVGKKTVRIITRLIAAK
jgi:recombination protein RecT